MQQKFHWPVLEKKKISEGTKKPLSFKITIFGFSWAPKKTLVL